ncbi:MAG: hypothetical protein HC824_10885 [Synechococcales cyanobacterium RM1_1_8]|nr:hypothetical protein [Synechococcales cyanobacterium RM1_1_8]
MASTNILVCSLSVTLTGMKTKTASSALACSMARQAFPAVANRRSPSSSSQQILHPPASF